MKPPRKRPPFTAEQYDRIVLLREGEGRSHGYIARELDVAIGRVKYVCLRDAIDSPTPRFALGTVGPLVSFTEDGRKVRRFTPAEDARIEQLRRDGIKPPEIATLMGRERSSIIARLFTLARLAEQPARRGKHRWQAARERTQLSEAAA